MREAILLTMIVFALPGAGVAQRNGAPQAQERVSLTPRFVPGESFRYEMRFENTISGSRTGFVADPQGPSQLTLVWNTAIRLDVLPGEPHVPGGLRLRITYESSSAEIHSDTFDPDAVSLQDQYKKLAGKVIEFTLDRAGKVISVSGLEGIVEGEKSLELARQWIAQLASGPGAPAGGVAVGQNWSTEERAENLPIPGLVWRTESQYLRNEACPQPNSDTAPVVVSTPSEPCAVILSHLNLIRPKSAENTAPQQQNGVETSGKWDGSGEGVNYVSLRTGMLMNVTQSTTESMDVTFTTLHNDSLRYSGTTTSHSRVALVSSTSAL
jgi:hypothetical protein